MATDKFLIPISVSEKSDRLCRKCYYTFVGMIMNDHTVFKYPAVHKYFLNEIMSNHPFEELNSCPDSEKIEEEAYNSSVNHLAKVFLCGRVMIMNDLYTF